MKRIFLSLVLIIAIQGLTGQDKSEFKRKFLEAEFFFMIEEYDEAAFLYNDLLNSDPGNANLMFLCGSSHLSAGHSRRSIDYLERAVASISAGYREGSYRERNAPKESLFALAKAYHINGNLDLALEYYNKYKNTMQLRDVAEVEFVNKQIESVGLAKSMIRDTLGLSYSPLLGENKSGSGYYNAVFAEGDSTLLFMFDQAFYTSIMQSKFSNGTWSEPEIINGQLKADGRIRLSSISFEGDELYLSKTENYDADIYVSYKVNGKWTPIEAVDEVNTEYNETHASLNKAKNLMFLISDRPEGSGARDIYMVQRNGDRSWGSPENLGKPVNSLYSEETPFLSVDGKTLYFSSMGHATMGGFDIFFSNLLPTGSWSYPANMGFPISTTGDDLYYFPLGEGETALLSSWNHLGEEKDIVFLDQRQKETPKSFGLTGKIKTEDNAFLTEKTNVKVVNSVTRDTILDITPDIETGEYMAEVPPGDYEINISSGGYDTVRENVSIGNKSQVKEVIVESSLRPEEVSKGKYIVAKNVLFDFDSHALTQDAMFELEKLYKVMSDNPELLIEVTGHTDAIGSREYNLKLSNRRSQSVVDYLVSRGISRERFISRGVGEDDFVAINQNPDGTDSPEGRRFNRQVEIKLVNDETASDIWLEEYMVPEHLKAEAYKKYYVVLDEVSAENYRKSSGSLDRDIKLYETERKNIYAAGEFSSRIVAMEYLNQLVDMDFPDSRVVTEEEFKYLLEPVIQDISRVKGPFTIQILALKNQVNMDYFKDLEGVTKIQSSDGIYRYIYGIYDAFAEASDKLSEFVLMGYTDCFVLPLARLISADNPDELSFENQDHYFTIQFSATRKEVDPIRFKDLGEVNVTYGNDGFYRYSSGIYLSKREADIMLQKVKEAGFYDAFIKKISRSD